MSPNSPYVRIYPTLPYKDPVEQELIEVIDICESTRDQYDTVTEAWAAEAMGSLNKGKSPDIYGMTLKHHVLASNALMPVLTSLMNSIFSLCDLPDSHKFGLLTPSFKKKGSSLDSKVYREITILSILSKLLRVYCVKEYSLVERTQNSMWQGFTKHSSLMNCSWILEEYIRENRDLKKDCFVAFWGAKAAFDVVNHSSLIRKIFHIGVEGVTWDLIHSLHKKPRLLWSDLRVRPEECLVRA